YGILRTVTCSQCSILASTTKSCEKITHTARTYISILKHKRGASCGFRRALSHAIPKARLQPLGPQITQHLIPRSSTWLLSIR
ncbi:hypothetical protein B0H19DRAFT_1000865, partial [Mycena capillaripes]